MEQLLLIFQVLVALGIIGLIMIQQGKGADMGASFGAGASQTVFGSQGSGNVLTKATAWLVALFFAASFGLAMMAKDSAREAGLVDMPSPALIEDRSIDEMPAAPAADDIPAAANDMPAADTDMPAGDIPQ